MVTENGDFEDCFRRPSLTTTHPPQPLRLAQPICFAFPFCLLLHQRHEIFFSGSQRPLTASQLAKDLIAVSLERSCRAT
jgi:hypothetical protein